VLSLSLSRAKGRARRGRPSTIMAGLGQEHQLQFIGHITSIYISALICYGGRMTLLLRYHYSSVKLSKKNSLPHTDSLGQTVRANYYCCF
jgi:hypothetical protein